MSLALDILLHLHRVKQVHDLAELLCDLATDDHYTQLAYKLQTLLPGLQEREVWPLRREPSDAEAEVASLVLGELPCGARALDNPAGQQILRVLQLQIYEVPSGVHSLQHLVKNSSMAQAELLRQLLVELLQEVLLGPQTCLALLLAADEMGLRQLRAAALRRAETRFPACTAGSSQAFFALPAGVVKHLLEHAVQKEGQEVKCFEAIAAWVQADTEARARHFLELFGYINLDRVSHSNLMRMDQHWLVYHNREATCKIAWAWLQRCKGTEPEHPDAQLFSPHLDRRLGRARRDRSAAGFYRRHSQEPSPASLPPPQHLHAAAASSSLLHPAAAASAAGLSDAAGPAGPLASCLFHMSLGGEAGPSEPLVGTSPPSGLPVGSLGLAGALPMILDVDGFPSASPTYPPGWQWPPSTPRRGRHGQASPEGPQRLDRSARPERQDRAKRARRGHHRQACPSVESAATGSEVLAPEPAEVAAICKGLTLDEEMAASPTRFAEDAKARPSNRVASSRRKLF